MTRKMAAPDWQASRIGLNSRAGRHVVLNRFPFPRRAALMSILAIVALPAQASIPGQPNSADVKTIDACIADAQAARTDPGACIGRISNKCLEKASTSAATEECSNRELLVWEAALNRDYAQLTALLTDDIAKQALRDAERDFQIDRLKRCSFERIAHRNAPDALVAAARCNVRAAAQQDLWLLDQINSVKPH
jgi:hypothetical protein